MAEGILILAGIGVAVVGCWRISLRIHPYARCLWCAGRRQGTNRGSTRKRWGKCRHCGGTGRRLRWGAREK